VILALHVISLAPILAAAFGGEMHWASSERKAIYNVLFAIGVGACVILETISSLQS
jgi:hypothetical protein